MKKLATMISALAVMLVVTLGSHESCNARTTRDLVFDDASDNKSDEKMGGHAEEAQTKGIKTTIQLTRDGANSTVVPSYEFKSGDKVSLVFTPSIDGYAYWLSKGSSGSYSVLFPCKSAGMDNAVKRNQEYTIPVKGFFKFDENPGNEEVMCILSSDRIIDLEKTISDIAEENFKKNLNKQITTLEEKNTYQRITRDLVYEDENNNDINTKTQSGPKKEPLIAHFVLVHK